MSLCQRCLCITCVHNGNKNLAGCKGGCIVLCSENNYTKTFCCDLYERDYLEEDTQMKTITNVFNNYNTQKRYNQE